MGSVGFSHAVLVAVGAFYTFAGLVGVRAALQSRFIDVAITAISIGAPARAETARGLWLLLSSVVVLAGGLFLILRLNWAAAAFGAASAGQALYLLLIAPRFFDPDDPPDAKGRQQTINAFILYAAATLFVLWGYRTGRLMPAEAAGWPIVLGALALLAGATGHGLFRFFYPLAKAPSLLRGAGRDDGGEDDVPSHGSEAINDDAGASLSDSQRILVMAEYQCDPLWTHDPGRSGCFSPRELPLSKDLIADLEVWASNYNASFNQDDYNNPHWNETQYAAHDADGVALARRLKRELPNRQIFVWRNANGSMGHTEIHSGE